MPSKKYGMLLMLAILFTPVFFCAADDKKTDAAAAAGQETKSVPEKTENQLTSVINNSSISYTVKTGLTPIHDDNGEEVAHIFSTSYLVKNGKRERPLLFLYNGGPGVASLYLHMGAFGPKALPAAGPGVTPTRPPYAVSDNPDSLLDVADLVFVDPVGTGYSRIIDKKKDGEEDKAKTDKPDKTGKKDFWGVEEDIDSIAEFIRVWMTENGRWGAPVFLGGESYGGLRTAGLAGRMEDVGVAPSGVILISPVLSYMDVLELDSRDNYSSLALLFPSLAMTAHYHGRLDDKWLALDRDEFADMVAEWCETVYLPALRRGNRLTMDERKTLANQLSQYCGIPADEILANDLTVSQSDLCGLLLRDRHLFLSAYDGRLTGYGSTYNYDEDPVNSVTGESYKTAFMRFLTETLSLKTGRQYRFISEDAYGEWDFTQGERGLGGFPSTIEYLGTAMRRLPDLKIFAALGRYDLVTPAYSVRHSLARLKIPPERVDDILCETYEGGHMMYTNVAEKKRLAEDLRKWIGDIAGNGGSK